MRKGLIVFGACLAVVFGVSGAIALVPNPLGKTVKAKAKAMGIIAYTADEASELAYNRCTNCHSEEKILKYCSRCGPPFIVVAHFMKKYVELTNANNKGIWIEPFTDAEIVAIAQAWNGLVGNWESDWPAKDLVKLLDGDKPLIRLLGTPVEQRPIEAALKTKRAPGSYQRYSLGAGAGPS